MQLSFLTWEATARLAFRHFEAPFEHTNKERYSERLPAFLRLRAT
jgi:hypothetical protein